MALYNGVTAAYLRQWTYGSCRMGLYSFFLQKVNASKQPGTEVCAPGEHKTGASINWGFRFGGRLTSLRVGPNGLALRLCQFAGS